MNNDRLLTLMGFAQKSGNLMTGEDTCIINIRKDKVSLVIIAADASDNTKRRFKGMCESRGIPFREVLDRAHLSHAIGKHNRTVFAIANKKFAKNILEVIDANQENFSGGE